MYVRELQQQFIMLLLHFPNVLVQCSVSCRRSFLIPSIPQVYLILIPFWQKDSFCPFISITVDFFFCLLKIVLLQDSSLSVANLSVEVSISTSCRVVDFFPKFNYLSDCLKSSLNSKKNGLLLLASTSDLPYLTITIRYIYSMLKFI